MKNLFQRTISGIVYLIILIGSLFLGKFAFGIVFLTACILALSEFYDLAGVGRSSKLALPGLIAGALTYVVVFLTVSGLLEYRYLALTAVIPVLVMIYALYHPAVSVTDAVSKIFLGLLYIVAPLCIMIYLVFPAVNTGAYTHRIVLGILTLVWINDTGAYVTGSAFGRHKLFPRISPKKSWEGLFGGTLFTVAAAFFMNRIMGMLTIPDWLLLAAVVSVFGVFGDLVESLIKRKADRKDSGTLIPGHGGILDRIDSVLFVMPVAVAYLMARGL
ncbi:MAG: phosphatidate cytidylyltransferase [Bacteroidales bacterium]|nr:phosphatidate cytidylyltransferase [Bacteroidales bacterium]